MPSSSFSQQDRFIAFLNINKSIGVSIEEIQTLMRSFVACVPELAALELEVALSIELPGVTKVRGALLSLFSDMKSLPGNKTASSRTRSISDRIIIKLNQLSILA